MHDWNDPNVDWAGINDAARYIALGLRRWGRVDVRDYKEKWGTVRVYCSFGWHSLHCLAYPGYTFCQFPKWLWSLDCKLLSKLIVMANIVVLPYHRWLYRRYYSKAIARWPHLRKEILCCADWSELLEGL